MREFSRASKNRKMKEQRTMRTAIATLPSCVLLLFGVLWQAASLWTTLAFTVTAPLSYPRITERVSANPVSYRPRLVVLHAAETASKADNEENMMDEYDRQSQAFRNLESNAAPSNPDSDDSSVSKTPPSFPRRVKTRLDNLLANMPSMSEMFSAAADDADDADENGDNDDTSLDKKFQPTNTLGSKRGRRWSRQQQDEVWFEAERHEIVDKYDAMLQEMLAQLQQQRQDDAGSVPETAEALMTFILREEMEREIKETRNERANQRIQEYEDQVLKQAETRDISQTPVTEDLQRLIDATEQDAQQREVARFQLEEFLRYEKEATIKTSKADATISLPQDGANMDQWALERLEEMAHSQKDVDGGQAVLDLLEESVDDLKGRLQKETEKGSVKPETMKEWQMYRSIATRLALDDDRPGTSSDDDLKAQEQRILAQLDSWKGYVEQETSNRAESGLSRGPRLPFEWQEARLTKNLVQTPASDTRTAAEVRKEINRMSIEAMESLLLTADASRRENLQKEIDFLKTTLEANDYLDVDASYFDKSGEKDVNVAGPVDLSGVFKTSTRVQIASDWRKDEDRAAVAMKSDASVTEDVEVSASQPVTPIREHSEPPPPPPNTPFFSQDQPTMEAAPVDSRLGDMEEQKLQAMFRRAGARSEEDQEVIRRQYNEYKELELAARQKAGMVSNSTAPALDTSAVDMSAFVGEDGAIDAAKILESIGPRPTRSKKVDVQPSTMLAPSNTSVGEREVIDSLYRSVAAVGGGRYKGDPELNAQQRESYEEFVRKEMALRKTLDDFNATQLGLDTPESLDDIEYAEDALAMIGPRPKVRRPKTFSQRAADILLDDELEDEFEDEDEDDDADVDDLSQSGAEDNSIPKWLRDEIKAVPRGPADERLQRAEVEEAVDDDRYEKNMQQLQQYEKRRSGGRQMGIDVSDVLGRSDSASYKSDDDKDVKVRQRQWGEISFGARKASLLDYIELDAMGLNSLMDHKDSVYSTGVSQYLPRVNKPFSAFGAIFRLEGVLVDVSGMHMKAWTTVASQFGFKVPEYDDVRRAAVMRPDVAVREAFFWTNDVLVVRDATSAFRKAFRTVFDEWAAAEAIVAPPAKETEMLVIGSDFQASSTSEPKLIGSSTAAWKKTAEVYAKNDPPEEDLFHAASLSPEVAVMEAFRWANDPTEVSRIVDTYNSYLRTGHATLSDSSPQSSASQSSDAPRKQIGKNDVMEFHFLAWKSIAEKYNFVAPDSDAVLSAFVIDDPYIVAGRGFGWTTDHELLEKIVSDFHEMVETQIREATGAPQLSAHPSPVPDLPTQVTAPFISIRDKALEATVMAWNQVAQSYHFNPPTHEMIVAASQMSPEDAIVRLFQWSVDPTTINKVLESYAEAIRKTSAQYGVPLQVARATAPEGLATSGPTPDDVFKTEYTAWHRVATKEGKSLPNEDLVLFAMSVEPEAAVLKGFAWTTDSAEAARLAESYLKEIDVLRAQWSSSSASTPANTESAVEIPMVSAAPGAAKWVKSLLDVEMSCAVVSFLESDQVDALLRYAGLEDLFPNDRRVSSTSGYKDEVQQLLGGALRVERRPDHCVIFDSSPHASRAALENDMRNVNLVGAFPKYELLSADSVTSSFDELTAMNIRRLFGERVFDQPQTELQQPLLTKDRKTSTRTRFQDDD